MGRQTKNRTASGRLFIIHHLRLLLGARLCFRIAGATASTTQCILGDLESDGPDWTRISQEMKAKKTRDDSTTADVAAEIAKTASLRPHRIAK
jgi:hypothetical protein